MRKPFFASVLAVFALVVTISTSALAQSASPSIAAAVASSTNGDDSSPAQPIASPAPAPSPAHSSGSWPGIGIGVKAGLLGIGAEVAVPITHRFNVRGGFNFLSISDSFAHDQANYSGHLMWRSGEAHLDWFPIGSFHISPGMLFYNGNQLSANISVPGGQDFTLNGTNLQSDPADPVGGNGHLSYSNKVAPEITVGFGNMVPRNGKHFVFSTEVGIAYTGSPTATLNLTGSACNTTGPGCQPIATTPALQADVAGEEAKINNDVKVARIFPIFSIGFSYRF